jgi:hypothetical protein
MTIRWISVVRVFLQVLIVLFQAVLFVWAMCVPLVWILRDGLGPDMVETVWPMSVLKTLVIWGVPALVLAVPLLVLSRVDRRLARMT